MNTWAANDPDEPHVHLGPFGVEFDLHGNGIGSHILRTHTAMLDRTGQVGYLETDKAINVTLYQRSATRWSRSRTSSACPTGSCDDRPRS